jgi:hypothetical protein
MYLRCIVETVHGMMRMSCSPLCIYFLANSILDEVGLSLVSGLALSSEEPAEAWHLPNLIV